MQMIQSLQHEANLIRTLAVLLSVAMPLLLLGAIAKKERVRGADGVRAIGVWLLAVCCALVFVVRFAWIPANARLRADLSESLLEHAIVLGLVALGGAAIGMSTVPAGGLPPSTWTLVRDRLREGRLASAFGVLRPGFAAVVLTAIATTTTGALAVSMLSVPDVAAVIAGVVLAGCVLALLRRPSKGIRRLVFAGVALGAAATVGWLDFVI